MAENINNVKDNAGATDVTPVSGENTPDSGAKKGFHPIQWVKDHKDDIIDTGKKVGIGIVTGAAVTFGILAAVGKANNNDTIDADDYDISDLDLNTDDDDQSSTPEA